MQKFDSLFLIRIKFMLVWVLAMLGVNLFPATATGQHQKLIGRIDARLDASFNDLIAIRRDLHRNPELSGKEERTAGIVATRLRSLGYEVKTDIGGHGVIGILRGTRERPLVAFRADMDAVLSDAPDPVEFRSDLSGIRHICGHDIHTTLGLALAESFAEIREELPGSVMLLFQPAEESATGARAMLADGVFDETKPDAIYAYHTAPLEIGKIGTMVGGMMAGRDRLIVRITGDGDLKEAGRRIREAILAISTVSPTAALTPVADRDFLFVEAGKPVVSKSGDSTQLTAFIMTASDVATEKAKNKVGEAITSVAMEGVSFAYEHEVRSIAGVTNDPELTRRAVSSARSILGADSVLELDTVIPAFSEDFGSFQNEVPGVFFFLGVSNASKGWVGMPHSPNYVADEASILIGAKAMAGILLDRLSDK
ncbi:MAG: amidohydrolase [Candidatus Latescibacteria bacterium]|nr:amidohydrolase [Candidatus Latescibacterota bacterium]